MMPKISKKMTGLIAVVPALLGFLWWYSRPVAVTVAQAEYGSAALYVYASGQVVPDEKVIVRSKNTARIASVLVKEGDEVTAGMTLVELAGDEVRADLAAAQASLDNARSEYEYRRLEYNRLSKLVNENAIPRRDFDQAATELSQAEGSYQKAQSQVAALVSRNSEYVLTSPFTGVVLERLADPGTLVTTSDQILVLGNKQAYVIEGKVDELDAAKVQTGQKVLMAFDGLSGQVVEGVITFVAPRIDYTTKSFKVKIAPLSALALRAGMSAEINILVTEKNQTLLIPVKALQENKVWVVDSNNQVAIRDVATGLRDGQKVEVTSGLNRGEQVIMNPGKLKQGSRVVIKNI